MTPGTRGLIALIVLLLTGCTASIPPTSVAAPTPAPVAPPAHGRFDYQIGGAYDPDPAVQIVTRDRGAAPVPGTYSICYVNAFQTQPEEASFWTRRHPDLLLRVDGEFLIDPDWPGEYLLDTSTEAKRVALAEIIGPWIADCAARGYAGVEPDNLDSWTRSRWLLDQADNLDLARRIIAAGHAVGLAVAQKNTVELGTAGRDAGFDFAVAEECQVYAECDAYTQVYGDRVIEIEYADNPRRFFTAACRDQGPRISVILRDRDVVPAGQPGYVNQTC